jgi:hypothetical protein
MFISIQKEWLKTAYILEYHDISAFINCFYSDLGSVPYGRLKTEIINYLTLRLNISSAELCYN